MQESIVQVLVAVCSGGIIALGSLMLRIHSNITELQTWRRIFEENQHRQYERIEETLMEIRNDMKQLTERLHSK